MNSPLGGLLTGAILGQMPNQISRKHAAALELVIRWRIVSPSGNADVYDVVIDHGDCRVVHGGQHIPPRVTLSTDRPTFLRLAVGAQDPMAAYFAGDLKFDGDVTAAMRMQMLFPTP
jgi:putative sterol carrier protein